jgi:hypothetical protein
LSATTANCGLNEFERVPEGRIVLTHPTFAIGIKKESLKIAATNCLPTLVIASRQFRDCTYTVLSSGLMLWQFPGLDLHE